MRPHSVVPVQSLLNCLQYRNYSVDNQNLLIFLSTNREPADSVQAQLHPLEFHFPPDFLFHQHDSRHLPDTPESSQLCLHPPPPAYILLVQ